MNNLETTLFEAVQRASLAELTEARKQALCNAKDLRLSPSDRPTWKAIAVLLTKIIREY